MDTYQEELALPYRQAGWALISFAGLLTIFMVGSFLSSGQLSTYLHLGFLTLGILLVAAKLQFDKARHIRDSNLVAVDEVTPLITELP